MDTTKKKQPMKTAKDCTPPAKRMADMEKIAARRERNLKKRGY